MQRILITGAGGMLGNAVYPHFNERFPLVFATDRIVSEPWLGALDVTDESGLENAFDLVRPDLVLHLAAETDLEFCERDPEAASATNWHGTRSIAQLCDTRHATLVYVSTAGVFDGTKADSYTEQDQPAPIMVYGQTKFQGEEAVRAHCAQHYIVRAGWMIGGGASKDKKFVSKILEQLLAGSTRLHAVDDRWGTPTYTHDFARNLLRLIDTGRYGTYHMVCEGHGTRYDVAREIVDILGYDANVTPVNSDFFKEDYFAPRPVSEMMVNANLAALGINMMRPWRVALRDYLERDFPDAFAATGASSARVTELAGRGRSMT